MIEHIEFVINDVYLTCAGNRPRAGAGAAQISARLR